MLPSLSLEDDSLLENHRPSETIARRQVSGRRSSLVEDHRHYSRTIPCSKIITTRRSSLSLKEQTQLIEIRVVAHRANAGRQRKAVQLALLLASWAPGLLLASWPLLACWPPGLLAFWRSPPGLDSWPLSPPGILAWNRGLLASWPTTGLLLASSWPPPGLLLAYCWPPGLILGSCWPPPASRLLAPPVLGSSWAHAGLMLASS